MICREINAQTQSPVNGAPVVVAVLECDFLKRLFTGGLETGVFCFSKQ